MKIAVLFHRLGPYHHARLAAAAGVAEITAVEASARDRVYAWDTVSASSAFRHVTLFEDLDAARPSPDAVRARIAEVLGAAGPEAVAIPGWAEPWALAALAWCLEHGVPAVVMSETTAFDAPRRAHKEAVKRRLLALFSAGLAGGRPHRDYLVALGLTPARVFTGYDVVDNAYFARHAADAAPIDGLPIRSFLASNRFVEPKNLERLLEAFATYRREAGADAWGLVLLGDGPLRAALEARRAALGLEGSVRMPGFQQYAALPAFYAQAGGFVHASTTEPWGLVVNEAMACGLPVLVSNRCGCAADLVAEGRNGWTFDPHDVAAMAAAMQRLAAVPETERAAMGQASRERIAAWGPDAFATGLRQAAEAALLAPAPKASWLDRFLLRRLTMRS